MKANFVCFKLSKTLIILIIVILIQLIFIIVQIKDIREIRSFEQIKEYIKDISTKTQIQNIIMENNNDITNIAQQNLIKESRNNAVRQEYEAMPSELKGYKIIRKNYNTKNKARYIYFRRNKQKIPKSISYKIIWSKYK